MPNNFFTNALASSSGKAVEVNWLVARAIKLTILNKMAVKFELKQEKKKTKPRYFKVFSSKYLGPIYLGPEEQEQPFTLRRVSSRW